MFGNRAFRQGNTVIRGHFATTTDNAQYRAIIEVYFIVGGLVLALAAIEVVVDGGFVDGNHVIRGGAVFTVAAIDAALDHSTIRQADGVGVCRFCTIGLAAVDIAIYTAAGNLSSILGNCSSIALAAIDVAVHMAAGQAGRVGRSCTVFTVTAGCIAFDCTVAADLNFVALRFAAAAGRAAIYTASHFAVSHRYVVF